MIHKLLPCALLAAVFPTAHATEPDHDAIVQVLEQQLTRNQALKLEDADEMYHLSYRWAHLDQLDVRASMGSLVSKSEMPFRLLGVGLRLGDPSFDNTGFGGGWENGFARTRLPMHTTPRSVDLEAWKLTDAAYKQAVEQLARKRAQFEPPKTYPGDFQMTGKTIATSPVGRPLVDADALTEQSVALSGAWAKEGITWNQAQSFLGFEHGFDWIVDSEGTRVRRTSEELTLRTFARLLTKDGLIMTDQVLWSVRHQSDLPKASAMVQQVEQARDQLLAASMLPAFEGEYVGPVLFEGDAAADLFRYLLPMQLEGTPPGIPFDSVFGEIGANADQVRLGRRLMPSGYSVADDPQALPNHPGSYTYDAEGTKAQAINLVEDGIVRELAMSRTPRLGAKGTNGHARGAPGSRASAKLSLTHVQAGKTRSLKKLRKLAMREARAYGHDYVYVISKLQEFSVFYLDSWASSEQLLPPPLTITKVYASGKQEQLRGATFANVQRWLLRDLVAAGPTVQKTYLAPFDGSPANMSPTEGRPASIKAPMVLVGEMELVAMPKDTDAAPLLPPPPANEAP